MNETTGAPDPIAPGSMWPCACVKRNRAGKMTHLKMHPFEHLRCRICRVQRWPVATDAATLRRLEWSDVARQAEGAPFPCCPSCGAPSPDVQVDNDEVGGRHADGCALEAAIAKATSR